MELKEFLFDLEELLQRDTPCYINDQLGEYEEWDSLAYMSIIAYYKQKFNIDLSLNIFSTTYTVQDLINLSNGQIYE